MKIDFHGDKVNVEEVEFTANSEPWNEYITESGERVRVKLVLQKIWRVLDENGMPAFDATGAPDFITQSHNVQTVFQSEKKQLPN